MQHVLIQPTWWTSALFCLLCVWHFLLDIWMPVKCVFLYFWHWFKKQCNYIELNTEIWTCKNEYNLKSILNNLLTPEVLIMKKCEYKTILQGISQFLWPLRNRIQFITVLIYSCLLSCWLVHNIFFITSTSLTTS